MNEQREPTTEAGKAARLSETDAVKSAAKVGGRAVQHGFMRDISSDPDPYAAKVRGYDLGPGAERDISSVTGSAANALLALLNLNNEIGPLTYDEAASGIAAIQREAVDAFIRDELPGLLAEALMPEREHHENCATQQAPTADCDCWFTGERAFCIRRGALLAAKVAELRK